MKQPAYERMHLAADWLESNDGDESPELREVATWLRAKADSAALASECRKNGLPVSAVRARIAQKPTP